MALGITEQVCKIWYAFDHHADGGVIGEDGRLWMTINDLAGYTGTTRDTLKSRTEAMRRAGVLERSQDTHPFTYARANGAPDVVQRIERAAAIWNTKRAL